MISERGWRLDLVLLLGFMLLSVLSVLSLATLVAQKAIPGLAEGEFSWISMIVGTVGFHAVTFVLVHLFLKLHRVGWGDFLGLQSGKCPQALGPSHRQHAGSSHRNQR